MVERNESPADPGHAALQRAAEAKAREMDAHRRAIKLQEDAVRTFQRLGDTARAANASELAAHARERLALAEAEAHQLPNAPTAKGHERVRDT